jgi:hypothetical protein
MWGMSRERELGYIWDFRNWRNGIWEYLRIIPVMGLSVYKPVSQFVTVCQCTLFNFSFFLRRPIGERTDSKFFQFFTSPTTIDSKASSANYFYCQLRFPKRTSTNKTKTLRILTAPVYIGYYSQIRKPFGCQAQLFGENPKHLLRCARYTFPPSATRLSYSGKIPETRQVRNYSASQIDRDLKGMTRNLRHILRCLLTRYINVGWSTRARTHSPVFSDVSTK